MEMDKVATPRARLDDDKRGGLPIWAYTNPEFLEIEKQELFDAVDLKIRAASSEAETKASRAEEEIERIHIEQSKVAEKILEENWNLSP